MIRTALFISQSGRVYFGEAALDTAGREERLAYDAIKDVLTAAQHRSELDETIEATIHNPASVPLTKRNAITLFLAFFTRAALRASKGTKKEIRRSIAMPVFEKNKQQWVSEELAESLAQAHVLAGHFGDGIFESIDLREAIQVLQNEDKGARQQLIADPPTVAEPIAAVAGHLLHFTPDGNARPGLMMVVDVGAGTTDIAMFAKGQVDGVVTVRHVEGSKVSLPWAGKAIDRALIDHLVRSGSGGERLRTNLEREGNGQPLKEEIFEERKVTRYGVSSSLDDFLQSKPMSEVVTEIQRGFEGTLLKVDPSFFKRTVAVRFSGGGYKLPFLSGLIKTESLLKKGTRVRMRKAQQHPPWRDEPEFSGLYNQIGSKFHRLAVALGGAYYCADGRDWLQLEDDMQRLG